MALAFIVGISTSYCTRLNLSSSERRTVLSGKNYSSRQALIPLWHMVKSLLARTCSIWQDTVRGLLATHILPISSAALMRDNRGPISEIGLDYLVTVSS